ncbi:tripartite tricarboxylate transporter substrate binding protein [Cupriavidus pauculus]|uniref:Bug family tripartite tricarboxylate transporter substrate binding protein n=1 Tax=Cupriavidus pauculus TaxID=82633 RepID=UPI001EE23DA0|nr:tripartite tricarboxylate transporter substrate binding protein [Cupriavidus pauculus]GJG97699.1 LacI family transcriptional regulator [Cupriavidus pauculus]
MQRFSTVAQILVAAISIATSAAYAEDRWPTKPISLIVPYAPGGTSDVLARILAAKLHDKLGQSVIVENKPGAGGNIGTNLVAKAKPDGYTFLVGSSGPIVIAGALYPKLPYKPETDFTPVAPLAKASFVVAVNAKSGLNSIQDIINKGKTGQISFGSAGSGSPQHIIGEMFNVEAKTKLQHIPYKGSGPLLNDLVGGQVALAFENPLPIMPQVKAGNIKVLAITSAQRSPLFPDIPTLAESGVKGFDAQPWYGMLAPAGLPNDIAEKMNTAVQSILSSADVVAQLKGQGAEPMAMKPAQFRALIGSDIRKWADAVKRSGATVD